MSPTLLLADLQKPFLQIEIKKEDRDAFRLRFNIKDKEEHLRLTRGPFGAEGSPFILGATLNHLYDQQPPELSETVKALRDNTYVDNLMKTGFEVSELQTFKTEATEIMESAKFPVHKWESNIRELESDNMQNPSKILGLRWDKKEDTIEIQFPTFQGDKKVTKKSIWSHLGSIYDPLGITSPTLAEGKRIYREVCDEKRQWEAEVSTSLERQWRMWTKQLTNVQVPRSIIQSNAVLRTIHVQQFADASNLACSTLTIIVAEQDNETVRGLLTSKSTITRLELIAGHMAANMVRNVCRALKG